MKKIFRILILFLIVLYGYSTLSNAIGPKESSVFDFWENVQFYVLIVLFIIEFLFDYSFYKPSKNKKQFIPSIFCVLLYGIIMYLDSSRESIDLSKTVLQFNSIDFNKDFIIVTLKEKDNFTLANTDRLGQTIYYGKYTQKGDTITLTDIMKNPYLKQTPITGIIQQNKIYFKGLDTLGLVQ